MYTIYTINELDLKVKKHDPLTRDQNRIVGFLTDYLVNFIQGNSLNEINKIICLCRGQLSRKQSYKVTMSINIRKP